jgi:hypothetical protein
MRVMLFNERFAEAVRLGLKRHSIRQRPMVKPGDQVSLRMWSGRAYRSKQTELCKVVVVAVVPIIIEQDALRFNGVEVSMPRGLALEDGFASWADMRDYFAREYGLPFHGWLIRWR